jgi:hypothetical protein
MVADLAGLVKVPSISGTAEENAIQEVLSARLAGDGLDVDAWPIPMAETLAPRTSPEWKWNARRHGVRSAGSPAPAAAPR